MIGPLLPKPGFWGTITYGKGPEGERVPAKAFRCKSLMIPGSKAHQCRSHMDHDGAHRCICGEKWERTS